MDGSHCMVLWHADDLKISHVSPSVVCKVSKKQEYKYGFIFPLNITQGKLHEYLGITIHYSIPNKVKFGTQDLYFMKHAR